MFFKSCRELFIRYLKFNFGRLQKKMNKKPKVPVLIAVKVYKDIKIVNK